jgi:hypothetical protein
MQILSAASRILFTVRKGKNKRRKDVVEEKEEEAEQEENKDKEKKCRYIRN